MRYRTDQASVQQALLANAEVLAALDKTSQRTISAATAAQELNRALALNVRAQAFSNLADQVARGALSFQQMAEAAAALGASKSEISALANEVARLSRSNNVVGGTSGGFDLKQGASRLAGVGALVGSQAGGAVFPAFAQVAQLGIAFGGVGVAAGVLGLALRGVTDAQQKAAESAKEYTSALAGTAGQTTDELKKQIEAEEARRATLKEGLTTLEDFRDRIGAQVQLYREGFATTDEYRNNIANINAELYDFTGGALGAKDGLGKLVANTGDFNAVLEVSQGEVDKTTGNIAFLNTQLNSQATAAADAAAAAKALADAQVEGAQQALEVDRLTKEQRDERIAQNDRDVNVLTRLIGAGGLSADAVAELAAQITELNTDTERLKGTNETYADSLAAIEARQQSINDQFDQYSDAIANTGAIQEKLVGLEQDLAQARTDAAEKIGDIVAKTEDRREEIIADAGERREEIEQNTQDAIARIQRDAGREQYTAIASRDALAFAQSQQKAADAISDQQKQEEKQLAQQEKAQAKQLASLQKAQDEQIRSVNQALDKETRLKQNAIFMQEQALIKAQYDEQQIALFGSNNQVMIHTQMWQDFNAIAVTWAANTVNTIRSILGVLGGAGGAGGTQAINQAVDARIAQTIGGRGGFVPSPY